ncbi:MAG: HIT domain-containing protein, partial [bacterium]|nr:HIT domain-containing protein [bacterium]
IGFISAKFIPGNEGHPLIACIPHFENIYDLHQQYAHGFIDLLRRVSIALKEIRHCDGVRIIQNNEPAAGQHAFHFHAHAIPRFSGDVYDTQRTKVRMSSPEERIGYARQLREYFSS